MAETTLTTPAKSIGIAEYLPAEQDATKPTTSTSGGWFRAMRTPEAMEVIGANPLAYILAAIIGHRGRYNPAFNRYGLKLGECLLGDYENYGMTRQEYRTAMRQLKEWGFATFRTTNKGTVGKLIDTRLFSIFRTEANQQDNHRLTNEQPTANHRLTTIKNGSRSGELKDQKRGPPAQGC